MVIQALSGLALRWEVLSGALVTSIAFSFGLVGALIKQGGLERLRGEIIASEAENRQEARTKINTGLSQIADDFHGESACDQFMSGLDLWRTSQARCSRRLASIQRMKWIYIVGLSLSAAAFLARITESSPFIYGALLATLALLCLCAMFTAAAPFLWRAIHRGADFKKSSTELLRAPIEESLKLGLNTGLAIYPTHVKKPQRRSELESVTNEIIDIMSSWNSGSTIDAFKPLIARLRVTLTACVIRLDLDEPDMQKICSFMDKASELEKRPITLASEGAEFLPFYAECFNLINESKQFFENILATKT